MSRRVNNGEIDLNKELTKEAIDRLEKEFNSGWEQYYFRTFEEGESTIVVDDYYESCFENTVERTINVLKPLGYILNGYIDYREDGDGTIYVEDNEDNEVSVYDIEDCWKKNAMDNDIIEVLKARGYTVTKNEPEAEKDADLNNKDVYTHDEATHILEAFEDLLSDNNIIIPSPEDDDKEVVNDASLYGSVYSDLLDQVEADIIDIAERVRNGAKVVEYEYSGTC